MENVLEKAATLATEKLNKINVSKEEKAKVEPKDATLLKEKVEGKKEVKTVAEIEAQAQKDENVLSKDDKELTEEEKKRKVELLDVKEKKLTPDDKIKRIQESSQKRIDEIKSELLEEKNKRTQDSEIIKRLEAELSEVKKAIQPKIEEDALSKSKREEQERINKYVEEDKVRPREDRREMSKEALEEWYLEDPIAATDWIHDRKFRRIEEKKQLEEKNKKNVGKVLADEFINKQNESKNKLFAKYPGVNPSQEKIAELKTSEALCADNEEFRICTEIVAENPKKYLGSENGPELVMAEMDKRLNKSEKKVVTLTEEELEAKIQAEAERRSTLDEGISSTKGKKMEIQNKNKSELRQKQEAIAKKAKISIESLDKAIERRKTIPGVGIFGESNEQ